jgi:hypothetical protein
MAEKRPPLSSELSSYFSKIGRKGGKIGALVTNAILTTEQRQAAGKKAAAALTPKARSERARLAAKKRWADVRKKKAGK